MKKLVLAAIAVLLVGFLAVASGPALVADHPAKSDAIVVLGGDSNDVRLGRGIELLREGYGRALLVNASSEWRYFGRTDADYAAAFIEHLPAEVKEKVRVCPYSANSTFSETEYVARCMEELKARKGLLVTSPYHTRRALSIFSRRLPQYEWSAAAAPNSSAWGLRWWQHRQWAKNHLGEWQRVIWWHLVDRWRA